MKTWLIASISTLIVSWLNHWLFDAPGWDTFEYFTATALFAIFMKLKD